MKTKTIILLSIAAMGLTIGACKKKTTTVVQKPTGVVFCKLDGVAWQSADAAKYYSILGSNYKGTMATLAHDTLQVQGLRVGADTSAIVIRLKLTPTKLGSYSATPTTSWFAMYSPGLDALSILTSYYSYNTSYTVNITKLDEVGKKISGNFVIAMQDKASIKNINITEGEFIDVKIE